MKALVISILLLISGMPAMSQASFFTDDFNDGDMNGWTPKIGSWSVGAEHDISNSGSVYGVVWKDDSFGVFQKIQVDAFFDFSVQDDKYAHLRLRTNENHHGTQPFWDTGYLAQFTQNSISIQNLYLGNNPVIASYDFSDSPFTDNAWNEIAFSVDGTGSNTQFGLWVNGVQYLDDNYDNTIGALDSGYIGLGRRIHYDNVVGYSSFSPVPEPASIFLFGSGFIGLLGSFLTGKKWKNKVTSSSRNQTP